MQDLHIYIVTFGHWTDPRIIGIYFEESQARDLLAKLKSQLLVARKRLNDKALDGTTEKHRRALFREMRREMIDKKISYGEAKFVSVTKYKVIRAKEGLNIE